MEVIVAVWTGYSLILGGVAWAYGRGGFRWLLIGLALTPLVGFIAFIGTALLSRPGRDQ
jgi:hypothetical protein